jgi:hypothetical protein
MRAVLIVVLGGIIWAASLFVPQVNLVLTPPVMLALVAGLTAILSLSLVFGHLGRHRNDRRCTGGDCRPGGHDSRTRPVPLPMTR